MSTFIGSDEQLKSALVETSNRSKTKTKSAIALGAVDRIEELEQRLNDLTADKINLRSENMELKAKLSKAMEALDEAIYLLDPDDEDIAKETGLYRVVTTYAELKGEK